MHRFVLYSAVFPLTLGLSLAAVYLCGNDLPVKQIAPVPGIAETQLPAHRNSKPEFEGLLSFEDYYVFRKPHGRLIHQFEGGIYRESEVVARNGENWLVLRKEKGNFSLVRAQANVKRLRTISWPGEERDAKLSFSGVNEFVFALNHFNGLKETQVATVFSLDESRENEISTGFAKEFEVLGTKYRLRVSEGMTRDGAEAAVLVLESQGKVQVIKQIPKSPPPDRDIFGGLIWAGDMDSDGKLDLYLDEFNEKGYTGTDLYLSTFADGGELLDFAGSFGAAGC